MRIDVLVVECRMGENCAGCDTLGEFMAGRDQYLREDQIKLPEFWEVRRLALCVKRCTQSSILKKILHDL
jgi:hypothetical protein